MEPWTVIIGLLAATGGLFIFSVLTSRWVRTKRLLSRAPRVAIADVTDEMRAGAQRRVVLESTLPSGPIR